MHSVDAALEPPIVCLAGEDWWYHPLRSRRQLMTRLSRRRKVLFVNSIGSGLPGGFGAAGFVRRFGRKARSWCRGLQTVQPSLFVLSPVALPGHGSSAIRKMGAEILIWQVENAMQRCGISRPILWIGLPSFAPLIGRLDERLRVFHASDRFDAYEGDPNRAIQLAQAKCIQSANLILAVSEPLADMARKAAPETQVRVLTHGVDLELFGQARQPGFPIHSRLAAIPKPRLGYLGSLEQFQDANLIARLAECHQDWHLVFVGPNEDALASLRQFRNIHFLPQCPQTEAPAYLAGFDLCMIPRRMDSWVMHSNPLKFKEYLAAGREVVASDIPALRPWASYAWLAANEAEFLDACEAIILRKQSRVALLGLDKLIGESWEAKAHEAEEAFLHALDQLESRKR